MNLNEYKKKKNFIGAQYDVILSVAAELKAEKLKQQIECNRNLLAQENFKLVVVGEFSRGKSTFINALLGQKVLPSSSKPTTAIITKISYAPEPAFEIHFRHSDIVKKITEAEFKNLIAGIEPDASDEVEVSTYMEQKKYLKSMAYVDIKYPLDLCKNGVEIIDTPGTNDLDEEREEITYTFMPQADAAVMLLSAKQPFSESERVFLKETLMENCVQKIFFVINHSDALKTVEDREKVQQYIRLHIEPLTDKPRIYLASSKQALDYRRTQAGEIVKSKQKIISSLDESGFSVLEKELGEYLIGGIGRTKLQKYVRRAVQSMQRLHADVITLRIGTAGIGVAELQEKIKQLQPVFQETKYRAETAVQDFKVRLANLRQELTGDYERALQEIHPTVEKQLDTYMGEVKREQLTKFVNQLIREARYEANHKTRNKQDLKMKEVIDRFQSCMTAIWGDMDQKVSSSLMLTKNAASKELGQFDLAENIGLTDNSEGTIVLGGAFLGAMLFGPIGILVGGFLGGLFADNEADNPAKQRDYAIKQIKREVGKHFLQSRSDWKNNFIEIYDLEMERIVRVVEKEISDRIVDMERQLHILVEEKRRKDIDIKGEIDYLQSQALVLRQVEKSLEGI